MSLTASPSCHDDSTPRLAARPGARSVRLAIAGNPNVGKTSLVNAIAGTNLKVGNWAGVTVEKREAALQHGDWDVRLEDLPGVYSLNPSSPEEAIARRELLTNPPDVLINVLDAGNLERNLYLTLQMLELGLPVVVALNLLDEAEAKGMGVDPKALQAALGVPVVPTIASRGEGVHDLIPAAIEAFNRRGKLPAGAAYPGSVEAAVREVQACLGGPSARFAALALLEGDTDIAHLLNPDAQSLARQLAARLEGEGIEPFLDIAEARYARAAEIARASVPDPRPRRTLTDTLDAAFLHRLWGVPLFALVVLVVFRFTFMVAGPFVSYISGPLQDAIAGLVTGIIPTSGPLGLLQQLLTGAVIPGVGTVLSFLPTLLALYLAMSFLEDSGYMARAAFLADRSMRGLGLEGKAFIPLVLGFGCNVPAVYATRTLERRNDRILVSMILPFMSCSARLPVFVIFAAAFFPAYSSLVVWGLYLLGMVVAVTAAWLLRRTALPAQGGATVLELPPYRLPSGGTMWKHAVNHTRAFVHRAGTT
ncbi:MAG TPA: ferrous iron transport protein B, partial [Deinococcales bacterium]|nr:ferrous iron transport protein B [Deinococcales bacterium]